MKAKRARISKRGWDKASDELVPIRGDRVRAALQAYGRAISALAREIGDSQQTVSLICREVTQRTRRSRVDAIADSLDVPPEWVTGEMDELPGVRNWAGGAGEITAEWQLAAARWTHQTSAAHLRDAKADHRSVEQYTREGLALTFMIHPGMWRDLLLENEWRDPESDDPADPLYIHENFMPFVKMLLAVLDPWIKGKNRLNYTNLMYIMGGFAQEAVECLDASAIDYRKSEPREGSAESGDTTGRRAPDGIPGAAPKRKK